MIKSEDTNLKVYAMHLRLLDNEGQYDLMLKHLLHYSVENEHMGDDVISALEDGLRNHRKTAQIENILSSRHIRIQKRQLQEGQEIRDTDTEGHYQVILGFEDGTEHAVHFAKKQDQILYIQIILASLKNGLYADFFKKEAIKDNESLNQLIALIYPNSDTNGDAENIRRNLRPDIYFTDIIQKLKVPIRECVRGHGVEDEIMWFLPYTQKFGMKRIYQLRMLPANISYPEEFQPIVDALPNVANYIDMSDNMPGVLKGFEDINTIQLHEVLLRQAEEGDVEAMNVLAGNYNWGTGVMIDKDKAFSWWKKAADLGHDESQYYIGVMYATGDGVKQDYAKATEYFEKAAAQDYADAIYQLGIFKRHGFGCRKNGEAAMGYFEKAAAMGNTEAMRCAAFMYYYAEGVKRDYKKAFAYYSELAKSDDNEAYWHIICSYWFGYGVEKDEAKARQWAEKGINLEMGNIYFLVGLHYYNKKYYHNATILLREAANRGVAAHYYLASMNMKGKGLGSGTEEETIQLLSEGVMNDEDDCVALMIEKYPDILKEVEKKKGSLASKQLLLQICMQHMGSDEHRIQFLQLIDGYREVFRERYQEEINKQLSIHLPSPDRDEGKQLCRRKIVVRPSKSGKLAYEIVLILANGEEVIVNKLSDNNMLLLLLTIICSFKNGYTTMMASEAYAYVFMPVLTDLIHLATGKVTKGEVALFVENILNNSRNYRSYSYQTMNAIKQSVGNQDEALYFFFENHRTADKQYLRQMMMNVNDIELPQELMDLAYRMPDAKNMLYHAENQENIME